MNRETGRFFLILFSAVFVLLFIGCSGMRVQKKINVKKKRIKHQPLTQLSPLKAPTIDNPSKTIELYKSEEINSLLQQIADQATKDQKETRIIDSHVSKDQKETLKIDGQVSKEQKEIPKSGETITSLKSILPVSNPAIDEPVLTKFEIMTPYQARLEPGWESNALKYISINGLQYSLGEILNFVEDGDSSTPFYLDQSGILLISLEKSFVLEVAFFPPNTNGHEHFLEFNFSVYEKGGKEVHQEFIYKRLKIYTFSK